MIKIIMFFMNGNTAVTDENGQQIPEYQQSWMIKYLESTGKPLEEFIDTLLILPDGQRARLFKTDEGFNWNIERAR